VPKGQSGNSSFKCIDGMMSVRIHICCVSDAATNDASRTSDVCSKETADLHRVVS